MSKTQIIVDDVLIIMGPNFSELKKRDVMSLFCLNEQDYLNNDQHFLQLAKKLEDYEASGKDDSDMPDQRTLDAQQLLSEKREIEKLLEKNQVAFLFK